MKIDINGLRKSYARGELNKLGWITGGVNAADPLSKKLINTKTPLWRLMKEEKVELYTVGWSSVANKNENAGESIGEHRI